MLHEVDVVGLQAFEAVVELFVRLGRRPAVDLGHQEDFLAIAVAQSFAHADFTAAHVVVPRVVEEGDAAVDGRANDLDAVLFVRLHADVETAQTDARHLFAGSPEGAVAHVAADCFFGPGLVAGRFVGTDLGVSRSQEIGGGGRKAGPDSDSLQEVAAFHGEVSR